VKRVVRWAGGVHGRGAVRGACCIRRGYCVVNEFGDNNLAEDGAKFAGGGGDAVAGAAVAGGESFRGDLGDRVRSRWEGTYMFLGLTINVVVLGPGKRGSV